MVVMEEGTKRVLVFSKGADSSVLPLVKEGDEALDKVYEDCDGFAEDGLRTLAFGYRQIEGLEGLTEE